MELPSYDKHFTHCAITGTYQPRVVGAALAFTENYQLALDIGAHVGFFSKAISPYFESIVSFEPQPDNYSCLTKNVPTNVKTINCALGVETSRAALISPRIDNSGAWELVNGNEVDVKRLDDFCLNPSLIKIDVQGSEKSVLMGAAETLLRAKPTIIVECIAHGILDHTIIRYLNSIGAKKIAQFGKDFVFKW